ncbi:DUF559 domain-containing protein [Pseudoflavonifractor phocaeensis]|nr:DUF559 domain-containing protein [Pseudoflavonifractor phocaeensis]
MVRIPPGTKAPLFASETHWRLYVNFYCPALRLAVELDGGQHFEPQGQAYDARRTGDLERLGVKVLRVSNLEVDQNFRGVCEHILNYMKPLRE